MHLPASPQLESPRTMRLKPLETLEQRMPFTIRAIQVDGGLEFKAVLEEECQRRNIKLFVVPHYKREEVMCHQSPERVQGVDW